MNALHSSVNLLMIDDDDIDRETVSRLLKKAGVSCELSEADGLPNALKLTARENFDCILLDYSLPGLDGIEVLSQLREEGIQCPVIMLTGMGDELLAVRALRSGAADYLPKDRLTPDLVRQSIQNSLEINKLKFLNKKANEKLQQQEQQYKTILQTVSDIIIQLDSNGEIVFINEAVSELGYGIKELLGQHFLAMVKGAGSMGPSSRLAILTRRTGERATRNLELELKVKPGSGNSQEGESLTFLVDSFGLWAPRGLSGSQDPDTGPSQPNSRFLGNILVARNFFDRKRYEMKLKHIMEQLQRSNQELQEFAFIASHDLQEPVRKIVLFSERLTPYAESMDDRALDYFQRLRNAAERMMNYIEQLLKLSRVSSKEISYQLTDLEPIILAAWKEQAPEPVDELLVDSLPNLDVDPQQFRQLVGNILQNSIKFKKEGQPCRVRVGHELKEDGAVVLKFADEGIGLEKKYADRIFKPFERLNNHLDYPGCGMGLAICKKIMEHHNGAITASGHPEEGTEISLTFPAENLS